MPCPRPPHHARRHPLLPFLAARVPVVRVPVRRPRARRRRCAAPRAHRLDVPRPPEHRPRPAARHRFPAAPRAPGRAAHRRPAERGRAGGAQGPLDAGRRHRPVREHVRQGRVQQPDPHRRRPQGARPLPADARRAARRAERERPLLQVLDRRLQRGRQPLHARGPGRRQAVGLRHLPGADLRPLAGRAVPPRPPAHRRRGGQRHRLLRRRRGPQVGPAQLPRPHVRRRLRQPADGGPRPRRRRPLLQPVPGRRSRTT